MNMVHEGRGLHSQGWMSIHRITACKQAVGSSWAKLPSLHIPGQALFPSALCPLGGEGLFCMDAVALLTCDPPV